MSQITYNMSLFPMVLIGATQTAFILEMFQRNVDIITGGGGLRVAVQVALVIGAPT